jgi:hypothetical protein
MNRCEIKRWLTLTLEFNKGAELFVGVHNEALSVVAVRVNNWYNSQLKPT